MDGLLKQLERRREDMIREHSENLAALDHIIALERLRVASYDPVPEPVGKIPPLYSFANLPVPKKLRGIRPSSLAGQILMVMNDGTHKEWTSAEVYDAIKAKGQSKDSYAFPNDPLKGRNAVSATMGQLYRQGRLRQIRPSNGGSIPGLYCLNVEKENFDVLAGTFNTPRQVANRGR